MLTHRNKSRSQSALPQRRWGSSLSQPHLETQQEHAIKTTLHYAATRTLKTPPLTNSPGKSPPINTQPADRARSALPRPLSGNVFMRNSSKRGWVAKAYPSGSHNSSSQPNLDADFFTESCESFDSFFDDEFEEQEKLGNLLSCNTLGVETKAIKQDWVSGEIDIPRFHCPRCRDHWYGISSEPCDEELARLIREGLWRTGRDAKQPDKKITMKQFALNASKNSAREFSQGGSPGGNRPIIRLGSFSLQKGNSTSHSSWATKRKENDKEKKKKRITFQLDSEESDSRGGSETSLEGGGRRGGATGRTRGVVDSQGQFVGGDGRRGGGGVVGMKEVGGGKEGGGVGENVGGGGGDGETGDDNGVGRGRGGVGRGREGEGDEVDDGGKKGDDGEGGWRNKHHSSLLGGRNGELSLGSTTSGSNVLLPQNGSRGTQEVWGSGKGLDCQGFGSNFGGQEGYRNRSDGEKEEGEGQANNDPRHGVDGLSSNQDRENAETAKRGRGGLLKERFAKGTANTITSEGNQEGSGETSNFVKPTDYGKRIRKPGGYMRAAHDDPASSEWADPLHARSFISSTATSRMGSTSNLHDTTENGDSSTENRFLPPIVQPISRPPPLYSMDFMGPSLTRPWTFSYH